MSTDTQALLDELEAVSSIYDAETVVVSGQVTKTSSTTTVLSLPDLPFSFLLSFPAEYPNVPPTIEGTQSTGPSAKKGDGDAALIVLRDVLGRIFIPGQVCLFDLIEETSPLLRSHTQESTADSELETYQDSSELDTSSTFDQSDFTEPPYSATDDQSVTSASSRTTTTQISIAPPNWTVSPLLTVSKSKFVARALHITSFNQATESISHLLNTNKKVSDAAHNITAWRIKQRQTLGAPEITIQDYDDDGETAAGGRLLHLMQLMDVWNVVVVVTRWYGGVKLGADRFRCINNVAREVLVLGGFVDGEVEGKAHGGKEKKR